MANFEIKDNYTLEDVRLLVERLRDPETGCPWDSVQTHESIRQDLLEESCELMEAIDKKDPAMMQEELGDVLFQVMLHSDMGSREGRFDIDSVSDMLIKKLVYRHPHVFGAVSVENKDEVLSNWEDLKRVEKSQKTGTDAINAVPRTFPSLLRSQKVLKRAAYTGFEYSKPEDALAALKGEIEELEHALSGNGNVEEEIGDVILSAVNVARMNGLDAERASEKACDKFAARFAKLEDICRERNIDISLSDEKTLMDIWREAKILTQ